MKKTVTFALLLLALYAKAQVKIGDNPNTINANSLVELESTNKGFLPPRVALNNTTSVSPLSGTVPAGMLVFSTGGSLANGYYYWDGTQWKLIATSDLNVVTKTANATLLKSETMVLASNDITLTLPAVTASDNGLSITVKNAGSHTDLITIQGNGGATIDNIAVAALTRYCGQTFVATGGNWVIKDKVKKSDHLLDVSTNSSWTTIDEVIEFLDLHMTGPTIVRLGDETYDISSTIVVDLPYPLTFQGLSYGSSSIAAASGLAGHPMFRCISDCYFKMLSFDATTLSGYGVSAGEDAIRLAGNGTYNEVKDCSFDRFYNAILDSSNAELWVFECDISNAQSNGILIHSGASGVIVKVAETDFIGCNVGVNLSKATNATIQLASGGYYNSGGTAILYQPATFTSFTSISITGNSWNNSGTYISGFDFTRSDSRDANAIVESNAGMGDQRPNCFINVLNSSTTKTLTTQNTWYKADWGTNTSSETCKLTIAGNKITYQPTNRRNGIFTVSGNLSVNSSSQNISIGIVKNGNTAIRYGETTLRVTTSSQPFQFSFIVYLNDIAPGDYFEIYYSNATSSGKVVTIQDIQWQANTQ
jgi:roadblock/LC7 domain-containing protein